MDVAPDAAVIDATDDPLANTTRTTDTNADGKQGGGCPLFCDPPYPGL